MHWETRHRDTHCGPFPLQKGWAGDQTGGGGGGVDSRSISLIFSMMPMVRKRDAD